jgi:MFS family permease
MMIFSAAPFVGPVGGPLISGFINQNTYWRWTYYVVLIWSFTVLVFIVLFVPETFSPELLRQRAVR